MCPNPVSVSVYMNGDYADTIAHRPRLGLNELLDKAASLHLDPVPLAVYELSYPHSPTTVFAAAIAIKDKSGNILEAWHSEPMFGSPDAALEHAEDMMGCELFALICDGI